MKINYTGRKFDISERLEDQIEKKLSKIEKFFRNETEAHVTISKERELHDVEVTIPFKGMHIRAEEKDYDLYAAIDKIVDIIERRIRKHKTKLQDKFEHVSLAEFFVEEEYDDFDDIEDQHYNIVKSKRFAIKPMDIEEAVMQMDLIHHQFFVFLNAETDEVNVVYKRKDGKYGLIEPEI